MIPLLAAIVLAGAAGAGPILVSDACGFDTTEAEHNKCAVKAVNRRMKSRPRPKELKVESEGKLYTLPDDVEMVFPSSGRSWWQEFLSKILEWARRESTVKTANSDPSETEGRNRRSSSPSSSPRTRDQKEVSEERSAGEHSCQICFEHEHSTAMLPCGHGGICWDCGLQVFALTEECPMCRTNIELLVRLDSSSRRREGEEEFVSVISA